MRPLQATWIDIPRFADPRGQLSVLEFECLPFAPHRLFYVNASTAGVTRGGHGHAETRQLLIPIAGRIEVELRRDGQVLRVQCGPSGRALMVEAGTWASQTYLDEAATLLVLCSHPYNPSDYIHDPEAIAP